MIKCDCDIFGNANEQLYARDSLRRSPKISMKDKVSLAQKIGRASQFTRKTSGRIHLNVEVQNQNDCQQPSSRRELQSFQVLSTFTTDRYSAEKFNNPCRPELIKIVSPPRFTSPQSHFPLQKPKPLPQASYPVYNLIKKQNRAVPPVGIRFAIGHPKPSIPISPTSNAPPKNIHSLQTTAHNLTSQPIHFQSSESIKPKVSRIQSPPHPHPQPTHKRYYTIDIPSPESPVHFVCSEKSEKQEATAKKQSIPEESMEEVSRVIEAVSVLSRVDSLNNKSGLGELNKLCPKDTISTRDVFEKESFISNNYSEVIYRSSGKEFDVGDVA